MSTPFALRLAVLAAVCLVASAADFRGVYVGDLNNCKIVAEFRSTSFFSLLYADSSACSTRGVFLGPITVTSPAADSNADTAIIISYVEVPDFASDVLQPGDTFVFDMFIDGSTLTMRNDYFETKNLWPTGGIEFTSSSDFPSNGYFNGNDTSLTYFNNEFFMRLGGFANEIPDSDDNYLTSNMVGTVEQTNVADRYRVFPVADTDDINDDDDDSSDDDDDDDYSPKLIELPASGSPRTVRLLDPPGPDIIVTTRPADDLNGVWYGLDPASGDSCMQTTDLENGIFRAFRFQCEDGDSDDGNLTISAYIGRYEVLPNNQMRLRYAYAAPDDDIIDYEIVLDYELSGKQLILSGRFSPDSDTFTITSNRANRSPASTVVEITVDGDVNTFNADAFLTALATVLDIPVSTIEIVTMTSGSIVVEVSIQEDLANSDADSLEAIVQRVNNLAAGTDIGGYSFQSAQSSRDPGTTTSGAATWTASLAVFAVVALMQALFM